MLYLLELSSDVHWVPGYPLKPREGWGLPQNDRSGLGTWALPQSPLPRQHIQQSEWGLQPALAHLENGVRNFAYPLKSGECHPDTETWLGS